jgi:hypothetical protein
MLFERCQEEDSTKAAAQDESSLNNNDPIVLKGMMQFSPSKKPKKQDGII